MRSAETAVMHAAETAALRAELDQARRESEVQTAELAAAHWKLSFLYATLDSTKDAVLAIQFGGNAIHYNISFTQMWRLPEDAPGTMSEEQLIALQSVQVCDPEQFIGQIRSRRAEHAEFAIVELKDGRVLEWYVTPQFIGSRVVGKVINYRDITQRVLFEQKMMFNQVVVERSGPMMWTDHLERRVTFANAAACEMLDYGREELIGMKIDWLDAGFRPDRIKPIDNELRSTGKPISFRTRYRRRDGELRNVDITASRAEDDGREIYILSFKDITELLRTSREKKRQQALLNGVINSIPDLMVYKDPEGTYLGCNDAFARLCGRPAAEIEGRSATDLFPAQRASEICAQEEQVLATLNKLSVENWVTYPDGRCALLDTVRSPLRDESGTLLGTLSIARDVTERKKAEEEIRRAKELAEEATRMKTDFLANMSHEIRTPMNAIMGMSHLALKTDLTARQRDYIGKVQASGQHLLGIINDILDFSKIEAGKLAIEESDFELDKLLQDVADLIADKSLAKGLELVFDMAPDVPHRLRGDSLRLAQILINYANNAVKYTDKGRIVIAARVRERTVRGLLLHFSVTDTGIGLTYEQTARLFQSFQQADSSTTRKYGGTGLGLAISKKLAQLMGGQAGVESRLGHGSNFWFTVRVGIAGTAATGIAPAARAPTSGEAGAAAAKGRLLLVEDNDINQLVAREILEDAGFEVEMAENGRIGLEMVRSGAFDLVLMDMQMPEMDGVTATREIRKLPAFAALPIVAMTANAMQRDRDRCIEAGMNDFVAKPFDPAQLGAIVLKWIRRGGGSVEAGKALEQADT
jgi:two-component system sensor histidine kinase/response regulator